MQGSYMIEFGESLCYNVPVGFVLYACPEIGEKQAIFHKVAQITA